MKIDAYTHFACIELVEHLELLSGRQMVFRGLFSRIPELMNVAARLRFMDAHNVDVHVLVPLPWLECEPAIANDEVTALATCRVANDAMARLVAAHPTRFVGIALIPTVSAAAMAAETERAVTQLGLAGVALFVGPTVKPPDHPDFDSLWAVCAATGAPVWLHPCRPQSYPDYEAYRGLPPAQGGGSRHQIWNTFGWIYDTSVAMVHIALAGAFRRHPDLKIVSHHHGAMVPFFTERFHTQRKNFDDTDGEDLLTDLSKFYCDTAAFGVNTPNIRQAMDFFGPDRVLFGSDTPMDMGNPGLFSDTAVVSVEGLGLDAAASAAVYSGNALRMMGMTPGGEDGGGGDVQEIAVLRRGRAAAAAAVTAAAEAAAAAAIAAAEEAMGPERAERALSCSPHPPAVL